MPLIVTPLARVLVVPVDEPTRAAPLVVVMLPPLMAPPLMRQEPG